jgi:hypothetical protein
VAKTSRSWPKRSLGALKTWALAAGRRLKAPAEVVGVLASAIAVGTFLVTFGPAAVDQIRWRPVEYDVVRSLHAGTAAGKVESILGEPDLVDDLEGSYQRLVYVRRNHYLQFLADPSGGTIAYTVTSCDPGFKAQLDLPVLEETVTLQDLPIGEAFEAAVGTQPQVVAVSPIVRSSPEVPVNGWPG